MQDLAAKIADRRLLPSYACYFYSISTAHNLRDVARCWYRRVKLDSKHESVEWVLTQLTTARWYLDRAVGSDMDAVRRNAQKAREMCDHVALVLSKLTLSDAQHRQVQQELSEVRSRLQATGE